jgi:hypothetical protein
MSLVQFNSGQDLPIVKVYYAGTKTLTEGQPLYYDLDDTNAPAVDSWDPNPDPGPSSLSPTSNRNLRGTRVIDVNTTNVGMLAGVVASTSSGTVGPAFIDIVKPIKGTVCNMSVDYNTSVKGDFLIVDEATPSNNFAKEGVAGAATAVTLALVPTVVAQVMQTGPTSGVTATAPAVILCRFL